MNGYPSYMLIDPQGRVVDMDDAGGRPNLRRRLLGIVRAHLLSGDGLETAEPTKP